MVAYNRQRNRPTNQPKLQKKKKRKEKSIRQNSSHQFRTAICSAAGKLLRGGNGWLITGTDGHSEGCSISVDQDSVAIILEPTLESHEPATRTLLTPTCARHVVICSTGWITTSADPLPYPGYSLPHPPHPPFS